MITMRTLEKLAEILNESFGPPFLEEDHVHAVASGPNTRPELHLRIGARDVQIDCATMEVIGSGTFLGGTGRPPAYGRSEPLTAKAGQPAGTVKLPQTLGDDES